ARPNRSAARIAQSPLSPGRAPHATRESGVGSGEWGVESGKKDTVPHSPLQNSHYAFPIPYSPLPTPPAVSNAFRFNRRHNQPMRGVARRRASASNASASATIEAAPITARAIAEEIGIDQSQVETRISASNGLSSNFACPFNPSIRTPQRHTIIHTAVSAINIPIAAPRNPNLEYPNGIATTATTAPKAAAEASTFCRPAAIKP